MINLVERQFLKTGVFKFIELMCPFDTLIRIGNFVGALFWNHLSGA
jgi:hypothetical protein